MNKPLFPRIAILVTVFCLDSGSGLCKLVSNHYCISEGLMSLDSIVRVHSADYCDISALFSGPAIIECLRHGGETSYASLIACKLPTLACGLTQPPCICPDLC